MAKKTTSDQEDLIEALKPGRSGRTTFVKPDVCMSERSHKGNIEFRCALPDLQAG